VLKNNGFHNRHSPILRAFSPLSLFAGGAPGAWYDPSDLTTLFQDSAGTTPVTAVEQPVGRMLDKSGNNNHAFQATSASRPVLSARYNLLTKTEQFDDAVWVKGDATVTANATTAPDGTSTADSLVETATTGIHQAGQQLTAAAGAYTASIYAKKNQRSRIVVVNQSKTVVPAHGAYAVFNLDTGVIDVAATLFGTAYTNASATITDVGDGWFRCSVTGTTSLTTVAISANIDSATSGALSQIYTGNGTSGLFIWGASLLPSNQSTLPYQRVNTATDYATTGFLPFLRFDGVDDSLSTNSISFTSTDKMSVFAGVRKLSDAAVGQLVELGANVSVNSGTFSMPNSDGGPTWVAAVKGLGTVTSATATGITAPITTVNTSLMDLSLATGDVRLRINGTQAAASTTDTGGGNFSNYPLFIGRRNNASLPFNGQLYSMIIVGKAVTAGELSSTETYVATKTGVTL